MIIIASFNVKMAIKLGLDNIRNLCEKLNNPQDDLKFIHIAGTNGKGSTGAFISNILKEAGFKTGWFSSPAVFNERETIKVNNRPITKKSYDEGCEIIDSAISKLKEEGKEAPSEFEKETALTFWYFRKEKCDIVVLECGMGGETDSTNIVKNTLAAVFTPISLDHTEYLGDTLTKIAEVKAGIIKPESKVISATQPAEVEEVLRKRSLNSLIVAPLNKSFGKIIYLEGEHQISNASLAVCVIKNMPSPFDNISDKAIQKGLGNTRWPGRFEKIYDKPVIILDGAHNEGAARALKETVLKKYPKKEIIEVVGMLKDKDHDKVSEIMAPLAKHILTTSTKGLRAYSAEDLAKDFSKYNNNVSSVGGIEEALDIARLMATNKDIILVFGSLSFHKEVADWIKNEE